MTPEQMQKLERGDIVRHKAADRGYVVMSNYGNRVTAVDTVDITNPEEWELVFKANHVPADAMPPVYPHFSRVIVTHAHKYLVLQERRGTGLTWSFPGGRCHPGESHEQAGIRETKEETGLIVQHMRPLTQGLYEFDGHPWYGVFYLATQVQGSPRILEPDRCAQLLFVEFEQLLKLPGIVPASLRALEDCKLESSFGLGELSWGGGHG